ncbi:phosphorylase family protein [Dongia deserti]|uniref:phosphorylase family protein n=1 Tax=Dongia deserti TaxID=2268030 RepID=UPI000E65BC06|nr:hypothetical protein [Dongia deserti]
MLGIVTGLKSEAQLLRGLDLICISTGGRGHIARAKIERLAERGITGLVSFGIAGALSPELRAGDIVIAGKSISEGGEMWTAHQPWIDALLWSVAQPRSNGHRDDVPHHAAARRSEGHAGSMPTWSADREDASMPPHTPPVTPALGRGPSERQTPAAPWIPAQGRDDRRGGVRVGTILGMDRLLSSPQEKADAFARTGALAADMESHHVARAAAEHGLPFIAIRAISDDVNEALPAIMASFVDTEGRTKMSAVLAALILGRVSIGELLQAGRASKRAHQALLRCRGALAGLR